jgi:hypothetical protein
MEVDLDAACMEQEAVPIVSPVASHSKIPMVFVEHYGFYFKTLSMMQCLFLASFTNFDLGR